MKLDESGYPQPTGEYETIAADSVVLALGQDTNLGFLAAMPNLQVDRGSVVVDADMMTSVPGILLAVTWCRRPKCDCRNRSW